MTYEDTLLSDGDETLQGVIERCLDRAALEGSHLQVQIWVTSPCQDELRMEHSMRVDPNLIKVDQVIPAILERLNESPGEIYRGKIQINFMQAGTLNQYACFIRNADIRPLPAERPPDLIFNDDETRNGLFKKIEEARALTATGTLRIRIDTVNQRLENSLIDVLEAEAHINPGRILHAIRLRLGDAYIKGLGEIRVKFLGQSDVDLGDFRWESNPPLEDLQQMSDNEESLDDALVGRMSGSASLNEILISKLMDLNKKQIERDVRLIERDVRLIDAITRLMAK